MGARKKPCHNPFLAPTVNTTSATTAASPECSIESLQKEIEHLKSRIKEERYKLCDRTIGQVSGKMCYFGYAYCNLRRRHTYVNSKVVKSKLTFKRAYLNAPIQITSLHHPVYLIHKFTTNDHFSYWFIIYYVMVLRG